MSTQALDRLGHRGVDLLGQAGQEDQGLDVAIPDAAAVGAQDAPDEDAVLRRSRPAVVAGSVSTWP
jgi:hypothetical protein